MTIHVFKTYEEAKERTLRKFSVVKMSTTSHCIVYPLNHRYHCEYYSIVDGVVRSVVFSAGDTVDEAVDKLAKKYIKKAVKKYYIYHNAWEDK